MKKAIYITVGLLLLIAVLVYSLPGMARLYIVNELSKQGLQAEIDKIEIGWRDAVLRVSGLDIKNSESQGVSLERLQVEWSWSGLWHKVIAIESLQLNGFRLDVVNSPEEGLLVGGFSLANLTDNPSSAETDASQEQPAPGNNTWLFELYELKLDDIATCYQQKTLNTGYCVTLDSVGWAASDEIRQSTAQGSDNNRSDHPAFWNDSSFSFNGLRFHASDSDLSVLTIRQFNLDGLYLNQPQDYGFKTLSASQVRLFPSGKPATGNHADFAFEQLDIKAMAAKQAQLELDQVALKGLGGRVHIDAQGRPELMKKLKPIISALEFPAAKPPSEPVDASVDSTFELTINQFSLSDGKLIEYQDLSQPGAFQEQVKINRLQLDNITTVNRQTQSRLQTELVIGEYGTAHFDGQLALLGGLRDFNIKGQIEAVDMRPLGVLVEKDIGHRINSGQLNASVTLVAEKGEMDSLVELDLHHLVLKKSNRDRNDQQAFNANLGMPLDTALDLLRDSDNRIRLKIPITGNVDTPDFNLNDAIYTASSKAITAAIINYYTPFGLVTVGKGVFDMMTALRFEPVMFEPGKSELEAITEHKEQVHNLATLLGKKPGLHLKLCGFANQQDLLVMQPAGKKDNKAQPEVDAPIDKKTYQSLLDLARARSDNFKRELVKQGVNAKQLIVCEPEFESQAIPGIEVGL